jgi:proton-translocating NAD(P)+ transhydrogenase subunit alpha
MKVAVLKETFPGENRVALVPSVVASLIKLGFEVLIEKDAGAAAGFLDPEYIEKGAQIVDRSALFDADVLLGVRAAGANPEKYGEDIGQLKDGQVVIAMCDPLGCPEDTRAYAEAGASLFSLELIPRITRAQSMDVLSSMATVAGYKAVLQAAEALPKMFPMMMTAAGTLKPARVFIVGAGVAGLQAIATAKRLGAIVLAYDVRPVVKEQCESLGAKFVELELETEKSEDSGGYAQEMDEAFYTKQREMMNRVIAESDVVITTAAVPGRKAPILVTAEMVEGMASGSVIVDLAAERGGNCELTEPGQTVVKKGVKILGPTNLASETPCHASQMFAKNITTLLAQMVKDGKIEFDMDDEVIVETMVTRGGHVAHPRVCEALGIEAPVAETVEEPVEEATPDHLLDQPEADDETYGLSKDK